jgi:tetratricopeptide (TPR) repeat protein
VFILEPRLSASAKDIQAECRVKIVKSFSGKEGISEKTLRIVNESDAIIDDLLVKISGRPMTYWGFSPDTLSIYPTGTAYLYLYQPDGGLLLPRQERDFVFFSRGPGGEQFEAFADGEQIAEELLEGGTLDNNFDAYYSQIREAFRLSIKNPLLRQQIASRQGGFELEGGAIGMHMQSIVSTLGTDIFMTLGETLSIKDHTAGGDPKGRGLQLFFEAERAFGDGDIGRAEGLLRMSLILHPVNARALNNLGYVIFLQKGDLHAAKDYVESALALDSQNQDFLTNLAEILWAMGYTERAEEVAREAMGISVKGEARKSDRAK